MKLLQYLLNWNKRIRVVFSFHGFHFCKEDSEIDDAKEEDTVADKKRSDCNFFIIIVNCIFSSLSAFLIH